MVFAGFIGYNIVCGFVQHSSRIRAGEVSASNPNNLA